MDPTQLQDMLLGQLRDIQLPAEISWWPPAPGWWWVLAFIVAALIVVLVLVLRHRARTRFRREAIGEMEELYSAWNKNQKTDIYLMSASGILRQVAIHVCGRHDISAVTGDEWIGRLAQMSTRPVPSSLNAALTTLAYQRDPRTNIDQAHQDIVDWLQGVSIKRYRQASKQSFAHSDTGAIANV